MIKPDLTIIQSPEAEKMRQMVTEGFYDRSRIGLWMFEVIGREYDDMAEWAQTLRFEAFPQTCTWSIAIWEFVYGFEPDDNLSLDYRRRRLFSRKSSRPTVSPARVEAAISSLIGCSVHITEHVSPYAFRMEMKNLTCGVDFGKALKEVRKIKQSHVSLRELTVRQEIIHNMYFGGVHRQSRKVRIDAGSRFEKIKHGTWFGCVFRQSKRIHIEQGNRFKMMNQTRYGGVFRLTKRVRISCGEMEG